MVRRFLRDHALSLVLGSLFVVFVGAQAGVGFRVYNEEQRDHHEATVGFGTYLTTAHFGEAVFENWESEFLQMGAYVLLTVWLFQRGSAESKAIGEEEAVDEAPERHRHDPDAPWPVRRGGAALWLYRNSLSIAFILLFLASGFAHAATGAREYSADLVAHGGARISTFEYVTRARFWFESFQNWQSEFMSTAVLVVLSIFLRHKGSPESKPAGAANSETGA